MGAKLSIVPEDRAKYNDLMASLPSMYILQTVLASQVYARNEDAEYMIAHYSDHPTDFAPEYASVHDLDLNTASFDMVRDLFLEDFEPASYEWTQIKGFELLDPIEVFKNSTRNRHEAVARLFGVVTKKLSEVTDARIFEKFKIEVIDKIDPVVGRLILEAMKKCALPVAAEALFKKHDSDTIVAVARGEELPAEKSDIIMPGDVAWSELFGEPFKAERISIAAERELLSRHLQGARGADEITRYLMGHVDTMRPSEVVRPQPDAPHDWIIAEFGSSPDLLGLLDLATLLTYLGYDSDQIKTEIALQAELADSFARPELAQIGVESEMVSEAPEGRIVNPEPFAWMFNVLPQDPKDKPVNEVMTAPSSSPVMQAMILSTMTDERFGFVDTHRLWEQTARTDRSPNSLHLNVSIPSTLPFTPDLIDGYMGELQRVQWLAYGGDKTQRSIARGRVSPWQTGSLLDVMGSAHQRTKAEIRNLRLEKDGSHITRIGQLQLLASACIQYMMERAGLTMTPSGRIMSAAYHEFQAEAKQLSGTEEALAIRATELIERYSTHIASELKTGEVKKKTGIIVTPN